MATGHYLKILSKNSVRDDGEDENELLLSLLKKMQAAPNGGNRQYAIFTTGTHPKDITIYFSSDVDREYDFSRLYHTLRTADITDTVTLYLSTLGGDVDTGVEFINAIRDCPAGVDIIVTAPTYSMGSLIALSGQSLVLLPDTHLMFHNYHTEGSSHAKGLEGLDADKATYKHFQMALRNTSYPFLMEEELSRIANDKDVYVYWDSRDLQTRLRRHYKYTKSK